MSYDARHGMPGMEYRAYDARHGMPSMKYRAYDAQHQIETLKQLLPLSKYKFTLFDK